MAFKKGQTNTTITLGLLGLALIVGSVFAIQSTGGFQALSLFGQEVNIPSYFTGECINRADNLAEISISSHTDTPTWYHCTTEEAGKWIPRVNGVQCEYIVDGAIDQLFVCKGFTENENDLPGFAEVAFGSGNEKCGTQLADATGLFGAKQTFTVDAGDSIYINTGNLIGDATLSVRYPSYGLRMRSADGFVQATTQTCLLNSINQNEFHTTNAGSRLEIIPDFPFNAVTSLQPAISAQAVRIQGVENGDPIYITRPGHYNRIKTAEDGLFVYVDTRLELPSTRIQCIPRTGGCSDDAIIIKIEDQPCDEFSGSIVNFAPVHNDPSQLCKYSCTSGNLKVTDDCIQVQTSCPPENPLWSTTTGECVSTITEKTCPDGLPIGDRILVERDVVSCGGKLLCELSITEPEKFTERTCRKKSLLDDFGLAIILIIGTILLGISIAITNRDRKKRRGKR